MPKTLPLAELDVPAMLNPVIANVVPDVFDERDLNYRPRLQMLPAVIDQRPNDHYVMTQQGNSCSGHAVASMINTILESKSPGVHVSPYMLYALARRYDEFPDEDDQGASLRGALKGWFNHGVLPEEQWPTLQMNPEPDVDDPSVAAVAARMPMGAFYRVNAQRIDDMQSAVVELNAVVASATVHDGWLTPVELQRDSEPAQGVYHIIERRVDAKDLGGHAFTIVGYNDVGFLVHNSWGRQWGGGGFATLPYDDWLVSAYDVWVARPGVPTLAPLRANRKTVQATGGALIAAPGPDLVRLSGHVVNVGNNGVLSGSGRFVSTPTQIQRIFERMGDYHEFWQSHGGDPVTGDSPAPGRVVLYAHGGLTSEASGLEVASKQVNWWLNNRIYPVSFAWETGEAETALDQLEDVVHRRLPVGGIGFDLVEQLDRLVEKIASSRLTWIWDQMKQNAHAASAPIPNTGVITWPASGQAAGFPADDIPAASLAVNRLASYVDDARRTGRSVEVHLVGHSAGSIFLSAMLARLDEAGLPVASLSFMAPAIRIDEFVRLTLPGIQNKRIARFASFGLDQRRELDDVCAAHGVNVYHKSLLYLVSRAFEHASGGTGEVPLLGMQRHADTAIDGNGLSLAQALRDAGAELIWSHADQSPISRSDSASHGGFDDDGPTMSSVVLRILGALAPTKHSDYQPNSALVDTEPADPAPSVSPVPAVGNTSEPQPSVVDAGNRGEPAVSALNEPQDASPDVPGVREGTRPELRVAPDASSPIVDILLHSGFHRPEKPVGTPDEDETP